jgi:hypothetical protein
MAISIALTCLLLSPIQRQRSAQPRQQLFGDSLQLGRSAVVRSGPEVWSEEDQLPLSAARARAAVFRLSGRGSLQAIRVPLVDATGEGPSARRVSS